MATERPTPRDKSIQVDLHSAVTTAADGTQVQGTGLTVRDEPYPTAIDAFPSESRMTIQNSVFSLNVNGTSQGIQIEGQGFKIESNHGDALSTLRVYNDGRIIFEFNPHPGEQKDVQAVSQIESRARLLTHKLTSNYCDFSGVNTEDPSTFESLNFGQTLFYFRREANISQEKLAARGDISPTLISKFECGTRIAYSFKTLAQLLEAFCWEQDDPRIQILTSKFQTEAEAKQSKKRTQK